MVLGGGASRGRAVVALVLCVFLFAACKGNAVQLRADPAGTSNFSDTQIAKDGAGGLRAASALAQGWRFRYTDATCYPAGQTRPWGSFGTPVVYGGTVYQGFENGCLVALDTATGTLRWQRDFGFAPATTCTSTDGLGLLATPAISQETDPGGAQHTYLYVHGPAGYLYKLDAATGADVWPQAVPVDPPVDPTVNDYFAWSSAQPLPSLGIVAVGMSSTCDFPFQRGGIRAYSMSTGELLWTWWSMPANPDDPLQWDVGGGVWTAMSSDGDAIYAGTGSATDCASSADYQAKTVPQPVAGVFDGVWHPCDPPGNQYSLVKLDARTGAELGVFHAPTVGVGDSDFGSGTTIWSATVDGVKKELVGACNKDGWFYALDTEPTADGELPLVWKVEIGSPSSAGENGCLSGAVIEKGTGRMFIAGDVIDGTTETGRVREVDPATGATIWETPLPANALGSGSINGNGVLAYAGMHWENQPDNGVYLLDASTGTLLATLKDAADATPECPTCSYDEFAQPVWADGALWMSNRTALSPWR
jgi:outer membrane protein assembly factor BamB